MISIEQRLKKSKGWDWQNLQELAEDIGFKFISQSGSHKKFWHCKTKDMVIIPANRDLRRTSSGIVNKLRVTWSLVTAEPLTEEESMVQATTMTWKEKIRNIREARGLTLKKVGEEMGVSGDPGVQVVYELEKRGRKFTKFEFDLWCKAMNLNPATQHWMTDFETDPKAIATRKKKFGPFLDAQPEIPVISHAPVTVPVTTPVVPIQPVANLLQVPAPIRASVTSDIVVGGELAMNRYRELEKIMQDAEQYRPEYEKLKNWLAQGSEILGV